MDTQKAPYTDVPNFKLAKVGKDRERKRGGAAWWMGGRGAGSFVGAGGGAGGLAGLGGFKVLLALAMTLGLCAAGVVLGLVSGRSGAGAGTGDKKIFADKGPVKYDDLSGVVRSNNNIPNSLGYVAGSLDGLTPEERARRKAEEEARLASEEAAKKKAEEDAAKQAAAPAPAAPAAPVAAASNGGGGGSLGSKFGRLSGGLSGGSGLSGGIGGSFGHMSGPSTFGDKGKKGVLSSAVASSAVAGMHASARPVGAGMGQAFGQLRRTSSASTLAASRTGEASAAQAGAPFDTNGGGTSIDGSGITQGNPGAADTPPSAGSTTSGGSDGGSGSPGNTPPPSAPVVPWQTELDVAMGLLIGIAVAAAVAFACEGKAWLHLVAVGAEIAEAAAAATLLGIAGWLMFGKYHQLPTGGIMAACAGLVLATCWAGNPTLMVVDALIGVAGAGIIGAAGSSLAQSSSSASQINTK